MTLYLAEGVHAAVVGDDIVFLDVEADAYFCLGGAAQVIDLRAQPLVALTGEGAGEGGNEGAAEGGLGEAGADLSGRLIEAGLIGRRAPSWRRAPPPRPSACLRPSPGGFDLAAAVLGARTAWSTARAMRRRAFKDLLEPAAPEAPMDGEPSARLVLALSRFEAVRPWLPLKGACLARSYHLRRFLRARGLEALWVFGVRTWPFSAHCWLQVGQTALDEEVERLAAYTPILAV